MPLMRCQKNKKPGWKFGKNGTCYTGKFGKSRAARQGRAIKANQNRRKK
jgi:hypothetical protein